MSTLYGISNCDTIRKARKWLQAASLDIPFHDVRKEGLDADTLQSWIDALGWEALLNKRGTTFRQLADEQKQNIDQSKAKALMLEQPAMIKRPVLEHEGQLYIGFSADQYGQIFQL